ncbi:MULTISPECIES: Arc family DNA-binding protein [Methylophaga]|jgi:plasmid stability protein|uniref:Arc-like DNA binding domain protein n=1 Tax=Methylophaga muralis TaxID=291169 RepID=A0A1E3GVK5_9GAMM|nr:MULTISPECIES: Arc family DNA-binding protein [Methylophaga]ODN67576.1 Arc-like DNA binding domain protein [Methylophaga muralis]THK42101.1 Arc family DNA-binding protein [Methylophaga sp. SB9B]
MSERKGPFGLRLPAELMSWLRFEAKQHNRSTTSEALFLLQNSLTHRFGKTAVREFIKKHPTDTNSEAFGLRIPDDLKTRLRDFSLLHGMSLNMEIVMRLAHHYEKHQRQTVAAKIRPDAYRTLPLGITESEQHLLDLFRGLNEANRKVILTLINNLTDHDSTNSS